VKFDDLTHKNLRFINEIAKKDHERASLLKVPPIEPKEWKRGIVRCGVVAKKLGIYPLWTKDGTRMCTTVLQIIDNHVIKYTPPENFNPTTRNHLRDYSKRGCILIGSGAADPNKLTSNYMNLFKESGVMPTERISRFIVHPDAALPVGTSITALHYRVGDYLDIRGKT
jgi:large subunit ribosomal protein L3